MKKLVYRKGGLIEEERGKIGDAGRVQYGDGAQSGTAGRRASFGHSGPNAWVSSSHGILRSGGTNPRGNGGTGGGNSGTAQDEGRNGVNVKVILRCRPISELERRDPTQFQVVSTRVEAREVHVSQTVPGRKVESYSKTFTFDGVCNQHTSQQDLFRTYIIPIVEEVLLGFNCTIFAYGQTGTGKTYTMEGDIYSKNPPLLPPPPASRTEFLGRLSSSTSIHSQGAIAPQPAAAQNAYLTEHAGIIPRAVQYIFERLEAQDTEYSVRVSYLEIYNEELNDLLNDGEKQNLRIYEDASSKKGLSVDRLEEIPVNNPQDIFNILSFAVKKRRTAETLLNRQSSRSHCIFSVIIHMKELNFEGEDIIKIGKLNLVDLAGSENIQRSGANAMRDRAKEAGMINQSLLTLGRVINALVEHSSYIPYRDSKLTRLLQESLGGRTKTCVVATISPSSLCLEETLSTLDYAFRAKNIRNRPEVNQKMTKRVMIRELNQEIERLKLELQANREKNGVYLPLERYAELEARLVGREAEVTDATNEITRLKSEGQRLETEKSELIEELQRERGVTQQLRCTLSETETALQRKTETLAGLQTRFEVQSRVVSAYQNVEEQLLHRCEQLLHGLVETGGALDAVRQRLVGCRQDGRAFVLEFQRFVEDQVLALHERLTEKAKSWTEIAESLRKRLSAEAVRPGQGLCEASRETLAAAAAELTAGAHRAAADIKAQLSAGVAELSQATTAVCEAALGRDKDLARQLEHEATGLQNFAKEMTDALTALQSGLVEKRVEAVRHLTETQGTVTATQFERLGDKAKVAGVSLRTGAREAGQGADRIQGRVQGLHQRQMAALEERLEAVIAGVRRSCEEALGHVKELTEREVASVLDTCRLVKTHAEAVEAVAARDVETQLVTDLTAVQRALKEQQVEQLAQLDALKDASASGVRSLVQQVEGQVVNLRAPLLANVEQLDSYVDEHLKPLAQKCAAQVHEPIEAAGSLCVSRIETQMPAAAALAFRNAQSCLESCNALFEKVEDSSAAAAEACAQESTVVVNALKQFRVEVVQPIYEEPEVIKRRLEAFTPDGQSPRGFALDETLSRTPQPLAAQEPFVGAWDLERRRNRAAESPTGPGARTEPAKVPENETARTPSQVRRQLTGESPASTATSMDPREMTGDSGFPTRTLMEALANRNELSTVAAASLTPSRAQELQRRRGRLRSACRTSPLDAEISEKRHPGSVKEFGASWLDRTTTTTSATASESAGSFRCGSPGGGRKETSQQDATDGSSRRPTSPALSCASTVQTTVSQGTSASKLPGRQRIKSTTPSRIGRLRQSRAPLNGPTAASSTPPSTNSGAGGRVVGGPYAGRPNAALGYHSRSNSSKRDISTEEPTLTGSRSRGVAGESSGDRQPTPSMRGSRSPCKSEVVQAVAVPRRFETREPGVTSLPLRTKTAAGYRSMLVNSGGGTAAAQQDPSHKQASKRHNPYKPSSFSRYGSEASMQSAEDPSYVESAP